VTEKIEEYNELTPKRRSILWSYDENKNAVIIGIKTSAEKVLQDWYKGELSATDPKITKDDGVVISLNSTATNIWELCNGANTLEDIIEKYSKKYELTNEKARMDIIEFFENSKSLGIIDVNWRSLD